MASKFTELAIDCADPSGLGDGFVREGPARTLAELVHGDFKDPLAGGGGLEITNAGC